VDGRNFLALAVRGLVACHQSRYSVAHAALEQGLELARAVDDGFALAWILAVLGVLAYLESEFSLARSYSDESLRVGGHTVTRAISLDNLGSVARRLGDCGAARSLHEESLRLSRDVGDRAAIAQWLANLGHVARALCDVGTARGQYTESLLIRREIGDRRGVAMTCGNLGMLAQGTGDPNLARGWLTESVAMARVVGDRRILGAGSITWQGLMPRAATWPRQQSTTRKAFASWSRSRTARELPAQWLGVLTPCRLRGGRPRPGNSGTWQMVCSIRLVRAARYSITTRTDEPGRPSTRIRGR
jgi:tetratricopeptide (TPR) repeat protein